MLDKFYEKLASIHGKKKWRKLIKFFRNNFGEKDPGDLNFNYNSKPSRITIVQKIIDLKNFQSYLEIGTFNDELFSKIKCKKKIGVDPFYGGNVRMTSDEFFSGNKDKFDCIFIDGLHHYNQVLKDINNSLNVLNSNGIILMHDCLPQSLNAQSVPRTEATWNGDVWKALANKRFLNNLDCYTICADQGIGVILKRDNNNPLSTKVNNFKKLTYNYYYRNHKMLMNIIEFEDFLKIV